MAKEDVIEGSIRKIVSLLVSRKFDLLVATGRNGRLSKDEIVSALDGYPGKLTFPLVDDFSTANVIQVGGSSEHVVEYDLWFDGKKSDLTLSLIVDVDEDWVEIDDIRVT